MIAFAAVGCGDSTTESIDDFPRVERHIAFVQQGVRAPELRGDTLARARERLGGLGLGAVPDGGEEGECVVYQQSPAPGGVARTGAVRVYVRCLETGNSCGPLDDYPDIEVVRRAGDVSCGEVRALLSDFRRRALSEGGGNNLTMSIGSWNCGYRSLSKQQVGGRIVLADCWRDDPPARAIALER